MELKAVGSDMSLKIQKLHSHFYSSDQKWEAITDVYEAL